MINKLFKRKLFLAVFTLLFSMIIGMTVFGAEPYTILSGDLNTVGSTVKMGGEEFYVMGKEDSSQISSIEITGVKAPTVGGTPKYDDFTVETEGVTSYTQETLWLYKDPENDDGLWHSYTNATFEAGKMYAISIFLTPSGESYQFADVNSLTVTVNGNEPDDVYESTTNVSGIRVQYVFGLLSNVPTYNVTYDVNGGTVHSGELTTRKVASGDTFTITKLFNLPEEDYHITVHPPKGKWFDAFEISGERYERGAKITITGDTVIKYLWKDITYVDKVELTIEAPIVGTKIEGKYNEILEQIDYESITVRPEVILPENVDYVFYSDEIYWTASGEITPYLGEIEAGKTYKAAVYVYCEDESYQFLEEGLEVFINGEKTTNFESYGFWVNIDYPMEAVKNLKTITFDLNGGSENEEHPLEPLNVAPGSTFTLPKRPDMPLIILIESGDYYITVNPPEGKWIDAFEISGERYELGEEITINSDTIIKCLWKDVTYIDKIELNIEAPIVGTEIKGELSEGKDYYDVKTLSTRPVITIPDGVDYTFYNEDIYWAESGEISPYVGKIEAGKTYNAYALIRCKDDSYQFIEEGLKVIVNGEESTEFFNSSFFASLFYPMEAVEEETTQYNVIYDSNGGTGVMSGETSKYYIFPDCEFTAPEGKTFNEWEVNGKTYEVGDTLTLTEDITVKATWKNKLTPSGGGGSSTSSYKITTKIENGIITPANVSVKKNADQEFTFRVNDGYEITDVLVDGKSIGVVDSYKLEKVRAKHTIEVKTSKVSSIENADDWAKEEMVKAAEKGLIPETFVKKDATKPITRLEFAAVAVKLYEKITGKEAYPNYVMTSKKDTNPKPYNPFIDTSDEYVLKAYALGITLGTSENTFTPDMEITREQMATMMQRALHSAGLDVEVKWDTVTRFADDYEIHEWAKEAVYSMANNNIIKGVGDNKFNAKGNAKIEEAIAIAYRCVEVFVK